MRKTAVLPALFFAVGCACLALLVAAADRAESARIRAETTITRDQVAQRIHTCIDTRSRLVPSMATTAWDDIAHIQRDWPLRAGTLFELYDSILALNYVEPDGRIDVVYPVAPNATVLGFDLNEHPSPGPPRWPLRGPRARWSAATSWISCRADAGLPCTSASRRLTAPCWVSPTACSGSMR